MEIPATFPTPSGTLRTTLRAKAEELETAFLAEMFGLAGMDGQGGAFGGGIGEEQFTSFLREAQARAVVQAGGVGLAERIFESLMKGEA